MRTIPGVLKPQGTAQFLAWTQWLCETDNHQVGRAWLGGAPSFVTA